ncbi:30S ribosomal protein S16 [Phytophthora cinnamomi]|uniref:30S ribosomal protein S16 n=1 Tax=Phytophthora cinnamomi TaxID=4785 RepID=UPI003559AEBF|nr:30S ribosomal protein S16 [Phytophthora cinnamomi]
MSLEPLPVFAARVTDDLEPMDPELLSLIAADDNETSFPMDVDSKNHIIDDFTPLNPTSTPTAVDTFNPGFSKLEVEDLMNLLAPEPLPIPRMVRSYSEPIKKVAKRTKKCTYAARRREVAFLRQESMVLEQRLNDLRRNRAVSTQSRDQVARETFELAKSQEENKRLRALVSSHEVKIRQADAYMVRANHNPLLSP